MCSQPQRDAACKLGPWVKVSGHTGLHLEGEMAESPSEE